MFERWRRLRPPIVRQQERVDCGPAALLSILRYWGGNESLPVVRSLAGTDARGSTLLGLRRAAEELGFHARGVKGPLEALAREKMPCIAHLVVEGDRTHYVVIYGVGQMEVRVGDPARGRHRFGRAEFESLWRTRAVLLMSPTEQLRRKQTVGWPRWISSYFKDQPPWLAQAVFLGCAASVLGVTAALLIEMLVDRHIPAQDVSMVLGTGAALLVIVAGAAAARFLRQRFLIRLNDDVGRRLNRDFLSHLYGLPLRFFEKRATGDIVSRIGDGVRVPQGLIDVCGILVIDGLVVVASTVGVFLLAPELGPVAVAALPTLALILVRSAAPIRSGHEEALSAYGRVEAAYVDSIRGIGDVLSHGASAYFTRGTGATFGQFADRLARLSRIQTTLALSAELAGGILIIVALVWGALLVIEGDLLLGQLMGAYTLFSGAVPATERIVHAALRFQDTGAAAERFRDLTLSPVAAAVGPRGRCSTIRTGLRAEGLSFEWPSGERLFQDLRLSIPCGQVTGLRGASGSGKTTLVRLLTRVYQPTAGRILADGAPVSDLDLSSYRKTVAVFHSETHLFCGSIRQNVDLGRLGHRGGDRLERIESSGFAHFLDRFPARWLERIGEGGRRLSHGERQVVGLMRALAADPGVLLVDEGLAGIDPLHADLIVRSILDFSRRGAVLLISHDMRLLRRAHQVLVLEEGELRPRQPADASS